MTSYFRMSFSRFRRRSESGTTATEMALLAPVFFLLLIGITELMLMLAAQQLIESASFNASRLAKTGYTATGSTQSQTVTQVLTNELSGYGSLIDTSQLTTTATAYSDFAAIGSGGTNGLGTAQQIVVYTVTYPWKLFTPLLGQLIGTWDAANSSWVVNLTSRIVVRNEPYD